MTIRSSIPAVVTTVLSTVSSAISGQVDNVNGMPVDVIDGELLKYTAPQFVQIIGVSGWQQSPAVIGMERRKETYDIHGMVRVYVGSDDQAYCRQQAFDLYALVETALNNNPSLGGVVNGSVQVAAGDLRMGVSDGGGRAAEIDFTLSVTTQLIAT
jgi:hypothetical protein